MMAKLDSTDPITKPQLHAKLSVMLSLLKAFKLAELLALVNNILVIFLLIYLPTLQVKLLAVLVFAAGLSVFYFAIRVRIDVALFERWDTLELTQLDDALFSINPKIKANRTLESRLQGSYKLFNRGLLMLLAQFCLLILTVWLA